MTTRNWLRIVITLVLITGLTMFLNAVVTGFLSSTVKGVIAILHVLLAISLIGLYEANLSRRKGVLTVSGRQLGWITRLALTATLLIGFYILLSNAVGTFYTVSVWIHALIALTSIGLTEMVFSKRRTTAGQ